MHAWAFEADLPGDFAHQSNTFEMEWPPHGGKVQQFPEIDRVVFFPVEEARRKMKTARNELPTCPRYNLPDAHFYSQLTDIIRV